MRLERTALVHIRHSGSPLGIIRLEALQLDGARYRPAIRLQRPLLSAQPGRPIITTVAGRATRSHPASTERVALGQPARRFRTEGTRYRPSPQTSRATALRHNSGTRYSRRPGAVRLERDPADTERFSRWPRQPQSAMPSPRNRRGLLKVAIEHRSATSKQHCVADTNYL